MRTKAQQPNPSTISLNKTGSYRYTKVSYPIRYGRYREIKLPEATYQFNLNHEIKFIQGHTDQWPSPSEWLKRTIGNDWVYYLAGDYSGVQAALGEYYLPYPNYVSNPFVSRNPFKEEAIATALATWPANVNSDKTKTACLRSSSALSDDLNRLRTQLERNNPAYLHMRADQFHEILGGAITVLPPDTRHVDYDVIPLIIADGCRYGCGFCSVKSNRGFAPRSRKNIIGQIRQLKTFFGPDLRNYNSLFLGQHDTLMADPETILFAARETYERFELRHSFMEGANLYLFGSVDALIEAKISLFDALQTLPFTTYINIGFESADSQTLRELKKPITTQTVQRAFIRMKELNRRYSKIEITANFVYGDWLPPDHLPAFFDLVQSNVNRPGPKGAIYFSPLISPDQKSHENVVRKFYRIKTQTPLPCYLYLIQRL